MCIFNEVVVFIQDPNTFEGSHDDEVSDGPESILDVYEEYKQLFLELLSRADAMAKEVIIFKGTIERTGSLFTGDKEYYLSRSTWTAEQ